jgi:hypothetical protein
MESKVYQYQIAMGVELTENLVMKIANLMKIDFDHDKYLKAERCENKKNIESICILRDVSNKDRFIMVDTIGFYVVAIVVRCDEHEHEEVKKMLLKAYNYVCEADGLSTSNELPNMFNTPKDAYQEVLRRFDVRNI